MKEGFSGEPVTRWNGVRNMTLEENFYYIDPDGRKWEAAKGSCLNGATIPRSLWTAIGSPYAGKYRRASVVHDVAVGELCNPDVTEELRKKADRMFYHACRYDGCSNYFAFLLYAGVCVGTWASEWSFAFDESALGDNIEEIRNVPEVEFTRKKFWQIIDEAETAIENEDLDLMDKIIEKHLSK
jgi:hypothetical protein